MSSDDAIIQGQHRAAMKAQHHAWMGAAGWSKKSMVGGTKFWIDLGDRVLNAYPAFSQTPTQFVIRDRGAVWVQHWARARHEIFPTMPIDGCAIARRGGRDGWMRTPGKGSAAFIRDVTARLREWAQRVDVATEISKHAADREIYGLQSFDHITALALTGRVDALRRWRQDVRERATRLHPLVKLDALDRAIALATSSGAIG